MDFFDYDIFSSSSDEEEVVRMPRQIRERINCNYEDMTDQQFKEKFRVSKETFDYVSYRMAEYMRGPNTRITDLSPKEKILIALHWLGSGYQFHVIADCHNVSKHSVGRCVHDFKAAVVDHLFQDIVCWPNDLHEINRIPQLFNMIGGMPPIVAGIADGTIIRLDAPNENEADFVDRYGDHSVNALFVCGPNREFYYANVNYPGSVGDSRILQMSNLANEWNAGWRPFPGACILADSAFARSNWIITPIVPPQIEITPIVRRFLRSFNSTRRLVENAFGILKERFPCLNHYRLGPESVGELILTCATIHNVETIIAGADIELDMMIPPNNYIHPQNDTPIAKLQSIIDYFNDENENENEENE